MGPFSWQLDSNNPQHPNKCKRFQLDFNWYQFVKFCKIYTCFDCVVINHQKEGDCKGNGPIRPLFCDFGDWVTTQSMGLMSLSSEQL